MSMKSQEANLRRLTELLRTDLSYIWGERESGPNGDKKAFLNTGKAFLRVLAKDLDLRDYTVRTNAAGVAVSGECSLSGMWTSENGLYLCIEQPCLGEDVFLYRVTGNSRNREGGHNRYVRLSELQKISYEQLVNRLSELREVPDGRAA